MNQLIKITRKGDNQVVNARELHQFLGVDTKFTMWIERRIDEYKFVENEDFILIPNFGKNPKVGRPSKDYAITLNMAKELSMVERNKRGRQARRYFIMMEGQARKNMLQVPKPKIYNGVECIHYTTWLLQNGYSLMSSRVGGRIRQYPEQFRKNAKDGWYMSKAIADYFLSFREPKNEPKSLPSVNPRQVSIFDAMCIAETVEEQNKLAKHLIK